MDSVKSSSDNTSGVKFFDRSATTGSLQMRKRDMLRHLLFDRSASTGSLRMRKRDMLRQYLSRKGGFYYRRSGDKEGFDEVEVEVEVEGEAVDVPKGYVPVMVGSNEEKDGTKFLIHVDTFKNEYFVSLLEMAALEVGYENRGILRIPCDAQCFTNMLDEISRIDT